MKINMETIMEIYKPVRHFPKDIIFPPSIIREGPLGRDIIGNTNKEHKYVVLEFRCKKCRKKFFKRVDEDEHKYVLKNKSFLNSKICDECKTKQVEKSFKVPHKK